MQNTHKYMQEFEVMSSMLWGLSLCATPEGVQYSIVQWRLGINTVQ